MSADRRDPPPQSQPGRFIILYKRDSGHKGNVKSAHRAPCAVGFIIADSLRGFCYSPRVIYQRRFTDRVYVESDLVKPIMVQNIAPVKNKGGFDH